MIGKNCMDLLLNEIEKIDINKPLDFEFCKFLLKNEYKTLDIFG